MGWSCNAKASDTLQRMTDKCVKASGSQNTFIVKGVTYFFETSRTEHRDGAITGKVMRMILPENTHCRPSGSIRIEGDGTITRAPKFLMV
jgi:hypothetical protein